ncbi:general transcription factor II-I repeat domain-containing protein 2B-like [Oratosquilla oratoria]|uniref:general transcription factor II-I repeat domain-containing protein 2B-like n=1 Tax=Oratosquilla oratoria TaxID=337810 RepID=UPI003F75F302
MEPARVSDLEIEIITLQSDLELKSKANHPEFWALVVLEKFLLLKEVYQRLRSHFGSTYMCESGFSTIKILKSKYRSRLTDSHLNDCMRMAVTNYTPEISKLAEGLQSQHSH